MKSKAPIKSLLDRKMENPDYRRRFEARYDQFKLEIQILNALESQGLTYDALAQTLHTKKSNISRDLRGGGFSCAKISRIRQMADALGMVFVPLMIPKDKFRDYLPKLQKMLTA